MSKLILALAGLLAACLGFAWIGIGLAVLSVIVAEIGRSANHYNKTWAICFATVLIAIASMVLA